MEYYVFIRPPYPKALSVLSLFLNAYNLNYKLATIKSMKDSGSSGNTDNI